MNERSWYRFGAGTGTRLTPALARGRYHWVLALADYGLSTAEVYTAYDRLAGKRRLGAEEVPSA